MVTISQDYRMTPEEFLEWEAQQSDKYEYIQGQIYAMTGGTIPHTEIALNIATALKFQLKGKGCKVLMADAKVYIEKSQVFFYPDGVVTCDERDKTAIKMIQYPCLIIEVLSPTTEGFDRGKKFYYYRQIETLREYILISAEQKMIDIFRLNDKGVWEFQCFGEGDEVVFNTVNFSCPIDLIYEDVIL
jgi:Uma2 family endonuclease